MNTLSKLARTVLPEKFLTFLRYIRAKHAMRKAKGLDRKDVFRGIYKKKDWGKNAGDFFSGTGSVGEHVEPYVELVSNFIVRNDIKKIVDLGCGDFRVGRKIDLHGAKYIGCDVVEDVVRYNTENFSSENISFLCTDIVSDELEDGDLCLIRQVLQHLSNRDISDVLKKLEKYKYVLSTDTARYGQEKENIDICSFGGTRIELGGGLLLDCPPFNLDLDVVLEVPIPYPPNCYLRTVLIHI